MKIKTSKAPIYTIQEEGFVANREYADGRFIPAIVVNSNTDNYLRNCRVTQFYSNWGC